MFFFFFQSVLSTVFLGILVMALKFDGLVEPYTGREGTEEWDDFWQKFLVLADISGGGIRRSEWLACLCF